MTTSPVTRCRRPGCGRPLRSALSVSRGIGKACAAKERAEARERAREEALRIATAPFSDAQIEKATALIARGGLRPAERPGVWRAASSDGKRAYVVTALSCECDAAAHHKLCLHRCAVVMTELAQSWQEAA
jgi:Family of unknown function (DUF6011)